MAETWPTTLPNMLVHSGFTARGARRAERRRRVLLLPLRYFSEADQRMDGPASASAASRGRSEAHAKYYWSRICACGAGSIQPGRAWSIAAAVVCCTTWSWLHMSTKIWQSVLMRRSASIHWWTNGAPQSWHHQRLVQQRPIRDDWRLRLAMLSCRHVDLGAVSSNSSAPASWWFGAPQDTDEPLSRAEVSEHTDAHDAGASSDNQTAAAGAGAAVGKDITSES